MHRKTRDTNSKDGYHVAVKNMMLKNNGTENTYDLLFKSKL